MGRWSYWIKTGWQHSIFIILISMFYGIFMALVGDNFVEEMTFYSFNYGTVMSSIMLVIINTTKIPFTLNLILSLGETRKNCVKGITIMNFTTIIINAFVLSLLGLYIHNYSFILFSTLIILPSINLIATGAGMLTYSINKTLSTTFNGVQILLIILAITLVGFLHLATGTHADEVLDIRNTVTQAFIIISIALGLILTIAGTCLLKKRVMQLEVKL